MRIVEAVLPAIKAVGKVEMKIVLSGIKEHNTPEIYRFNSFPPIPPTEGDFEEMPLLAGQGVGLIHKVEPIKEIISSMMYDAAKTLASFSKKNK